VRVITGRKKNIMRFSRIEKIIAHLNNYHSLQGSDSDLPEVYRAMAYSRREVEKLTGLSIFEIPSTFEGAVIFLKKHFNGQ